MAERRRGEKVKTRVRRPAATAKSGAKGGKRVERSEASPSYRVRELDPIARCGARTTVMRLFRVDELPLASRLVHLVFLDRHGWYCEHGPQCPAVAAVRRRGKRGIAN